MRSAASAAAAGSSASGGGASRDHCERGADGRACRNLSIGGRHRVEYAGTAIQLVASGRVDLDSMVTAYDGLHDVAAALTASRSDPTTVKAIVRPGD